jgi:16S rRNA processing protein RimM
VDVTVARIGAARGLRGEVRLDVRTDSPRTRLSPGTVLHTDPPDAGPLTVCSVRQERSAWFVTFAEAPDRSAAEALRGVALLAEADDGEEDAWYPHELAGLAAFLPDGTPLGRIEGLEPAPAHDLLVLREVSGQRTLIPFVHAIVPVVDVAGGRVVLTPPGGLLASLGQRDDDAGSGDEGAGDEGGDEAGRDDAGGAG